MGENAEFSRRKLPFYQDKIIKRKLNDKLLKKNYEVIEEVEKALE